MAKQKKGEGFHSAAGLIRYFDAEEKSSLRIPPWFVIAMCIATVIVVTIVHVIVKIPVV
jgi:preprotein translocase subunit Sec61beta